MGKTCEWIVEYKCGCSRSFPNKADILMYCATHGEDLRGAFSLGVERMKDCPLCGRKIKRATNEPGALGDIVSKIGPLEGAK